jgi:hypothetical protein
MGVLPVPDEIRDMAKGIGDLITQIKTQNALLEKIFNQMTVLTAGFGDVHIIRERIDAMQGTLTTSKDALRLMSTLMERKL